MDTPPMIGMVLVTHGRLAVEFIAALEHVVGDQENIAAVCIGPDDDMEQRRMEILESCAKVDTGSGVVLLTLTLHISRPALSKFIILGGGTVRRQKVYKLRRYTPSSFATTYLNPFALTSSHKPAGWYGITDGPPCLRTNNPAAASA